MEGEVLRDQLLNELNEHELVKRRALFEVTDRYILFADHSNHAKRSFKAWSTTLAARVQLMSHIPADAPTFISSSTLPIIQNAPARIPVSPFSLKWGPWPFSSHIQRRTLLRRLVYLAHVYLDVPTDWFTQLIFLHIGTRYDPRIHINNFGAWNSRIPSHRPIRFLDLILEPRRSISAPILSFTFSL